MATLQISSKLGLPLDLVTEATAIVATRGAGKSSTSAVIVEEAFNLAVQVVVFDRTGVYWGLQSNAKGDGPGLPIYVLGGPHGDVPLEPHAGVMVADLVVDSGHSFVLDLSDFSKANAIKFAAAFLEHLYDRKARARTTTLLVIDEAHFYAPQTPRGGFKGDSAKLMGAMEDAVGLGRSRGLGVVLTTQRTQALNKAVLDMIETLLVMRMLSPRAREAVRAWILEKHEQDDQGVIPTLDSLPTGTAWVWSPLRAVLEKVPVRRIRTFDSYETPKPGQVRVEPTARAPLDLDALGEQIAATVERAKENSRSATRLRSSAGRRLREAEAALGKPTEVEVPVPVEVSVLTDEDRYLLGKLEVLAPSLSTAVADLEELRSLVERAERVAHTTPSPLPARREPEPAASPSPPPPRPSAPLERASDTNGSLGTAARGFLETLARFYPMPLTVGQLGLLAGKKTRGGSFNTAMRQLRDGGYLVDADGELRLTAEGEREAGVVPEPMTLVRWRAVLPTAPREILDELVAAGGLLSVAEIAERTGRAPRGGSWNTALKMLLQSETVRRDGDHLVLAAEYALS